MQKTIHEFPMDYRRQTHQDRGFETEQDELEALREYVQSLYVDSEPAQLVDYFVIVANICENRALLDGDNPPVAEWYLKTASLMREMLKHITKGPHAPKANEAFEHEYLYYFDTEDMN